MGALEDKKFQMVVGGATITGGLYVAVKLSWFRKNPLHSFGGKTGAMAKSMVDRGIKSYNEFFDQEDGKGVGSRILSTPDFVNKFYSLITDFYEYGWGESFENSIIRQEVGTFIAQSLTTRRVEVKSYR